jgi:hypothetical protein
VERQCESGNQEHCVLRIQNEHINIDDKHKDKESTTTTMSASNKKEQQQQQQQQHDLFQTSWSRDSSREFCAISNLWRS